MTRIRRHRTPGCIATALVCALTLTGCSRATKTGKGSKDGTVPASAAGPAAGALDFSVDAGRIEPASPAGAARLLYAFLNAKYTDRAGGETPGTLLQTGQTPPTGTSIALDVYANKAADLQHACAHFAPAAGYFLGADTYQLRLTGITPVLNGLLQPAKNFAPRTCPAAPTTTLDPGAAIRPRVDEDLEVQTSLFISSFYDHVDWYGGVGGASGPPPETDYVVRGDRSAALPHCAALQSLTRWYTGSPQYKVGVIPRPDPNATARPKAVPCPG